MLTARNRPSPESVSAEIAAKRPSAISQTLRAICDAIDDPQERWLLAGSKGNSGYRIHVANCRESRERAYALAQRVYKKCNYVAAGQGELCVSSYDAKPETLTLLIEDMNGQDVGTVSLVADSSEGLPCDEIYLDETNALRRSGGKLAEVTRLAIDEAHAGSTQLLIQMFNFVYIYARRVIRCSNLLAEVTPSHARYYRKLLKFEDAGPEKPCPRVNGTYGVLLSLNLSAIEAVVIGTGCRHGRDLSGHRLQPYPYSKTEEAEIANFLSRRHKSMSADEADYFGLLPAVKQSVLAMTEK